MKPCSQFIEAVVLAAEHARASQPAARRRVLAAWLVREFVPEMPFCGRDLRAWIVPGIEFTKLERKAAQWDVSGFRSVLIAGGQGAEALRHLGAAAAAVLMRRRALVWAASIVDWAQGFVRGRRPESRAELDGNHAGVEMGRLLRGYLRGELSRDLLARSLQTLVCAETPTRDA